MKYKSISRFFLIVGVAGGLMSFDTPDQQPDSQQNSKVIVSLVANMLKFWHYEPQKINDDFSKKLFIKYLNALDTEKKLFLQSDIDYLNKYELLIDDEINGKQQLEFLSATDSILDIRILQAPKNYTKAINKSLNLKEQEFIQLDQNKLTFATSEKENEGVWRKSVKYSTLLKLDELQDARKNAKPNDPIAKQSDADLLKQATEKAKRKFDKYFNQLNTTLSKSVRFEMFVNCIVTTLDVHSTYMAPVTERGFKEQTTGTYCGVGVALKEEEDYVKIESIIPGGPAWKQGALKAGDVILKVGQGDQPQVDVTDFNITELRKLTRGTKGSTVVFTVKELNGTIKTVSLVRDELKQEDVFAHSYIIDGSHKIGMIVLPSFYQSKNGPKGPGSSSYDVAKEVEKLKAEKVAGIVIDLRFNGGGSLVDVVDIAGLFIPQGPVVQVRDGNGKIQVLEDTNAGVAYDGPLAIMVNEYSASASEILAAAMQDYKRAVIIGSPMTFGKGTVQRTFELNRSLPQNEQDNFGDLGGVKLTIQKFYRINGSSTQLKGVTPDIILRDQYADHAEKNLKAVLKWDEIAGTNYTALANGFNLDLLRQNSTKRVESNPAFARIEQNIAAMVKWNENKLIPLEKSAFMVKRKADKAQSLANDQTGETSNVVNITNLKTSEPLSDFALERNKRSLKTYRTDQYLAESVQVMNDMINLAKKVN